METLPRKRSPAEEGSDVPPEAAPSRVELDEPLPLFWSNAGEGEQSPFRAALQGRRMWCLDDGDQRDVFHLVHLGELVLLADSQVDILVGIDATLQAAVLERQGRRVLVATVLDEEVPQTILGRVELGLQVLSPPVEEDALRMGGGV